MSGKDDMWWIDEDEPGEEEYVEYFDARSRRWVRVPKHMVEDYEAGQGPGDDFPEQQGYVDSGGEGGWIVFDSDSPAEGLLRGRGEAGRRDAGKRIQPNTGLKLYLILSSVMAGLLAASGRLLELGIVGASIVTVLMVWRWRGRWA
jgi:hypothetical protein